MSRRQLLTYVASWRGTLAPHGTGLRPLLDEAPGTWSLGPRPPAEFPLLPSRDQGVLDLLCWGFRRLPGMGRDGRPSSLEELPRLIGDLRLDEHATGARMRAIHCVGARLFFEWRHATARFPGESQPPWPWTAWRAPVR